MAPTNWEFAGLITHYFRLASVWTLERPRLPLIDAPTVSSGEHEQHDSGLSSRALEALEWFKETYKEQLRRISEPGGDNGINAVDMMTAENWLCRDELVTIYRESVQRVLAAHHLSYAPGFGGDPALLLAAARFYNGFFKPTSPVLPEHIVAGAGCSSLLASLMHDLCGPGEGVLVEVPYWGTVDACVAMIDILLTICRRWLRDGMHYACTGADGSCRYYSLLLVSRAQP